MSSDPINRLNIASSEIERQWLNEFQNAAPDVFLGGQKSNPAVPLLAVTFVRIPDLRLENPQLTEELPQGLAGATVDTSETKQSPALPPRQLKSEVPVRPVDLGTIGVAKQITLGVGSQIAALPVAKMSKSYSATSELSEKPSDWMGGNDGSNADKDRSPASSSAVEGDQQAITSLVTQIIAQFPVGSPTALLFSGAGELAQVDELCAQVAKVLSEQNVGKVLLVDSEFEKSALTSASGRKRNSGLRNTMVSESEWRESIVADSRSCMDFLPVGREDLRSWEKANERKQELILEFKQEYQFICVSVGDSHGDPASYWADVCDATFLVISVEKTRQTLALSAVDQLRCNGARLYGCIVVDNQPR